VLVVVLLASACVFPTDEPTGIEFSWQFLEVNEADGEDARRTLTCDGVAAEQVAAHVADVDSPERRGTFRFDCAQGFQTASDAALEASDAFVQLHPGDYDVTLAIETPGGADELLGARTVDVLSRAATVELWELQRAPVTWTLSIAGADACQQMSLALYYDAPSQALAEPPLDEEGEPTAVLYREMLASDRGLGLAAMSMACADAAGEHVVADMDRGDFRLEVTVDGVTCPFAFTIGPQTTTSLDLGALPCG
jgi:hypothetical protein